MGTGRSPATYAHYAQIVERRRPNDMHTCAWSIRTSHASQYRTRTRNMRMSHRHAAAAAASAFAESRALAPTTLEPLARSSEHGRPA